MKKSPNIPLTLSHQLHAEIREVSVELQLSQADTMRQAMRLGLPLLRSNLTAPVFMPPPGYFADCYQDPEDLAFEAKMVKHASKKAER